MPIVQVEIMKGRTIEQKRELAKNVTKAICESINCQAEAVSIIIREMEQQDYAHAGKLACDNQ